MHLSNSLTLPQASIRSKKNNALVNSSWQSLLTGQVGNLDSYIQAVNRIPMLSAEEEQRLATEYQQFNCLEAARQLVLSHLRLVVSIARNYLGYGLPHEDLIQEGNLGLMKAVKRFDPKQNVRLVSYAMHWIKAEIHEYILRNWRMVKLATTKAQRKLFFNLRSRKQDLQSFSPDEADSLAKELKVKKSDVTEMEMRLAGNDIALENQVEDDYEPSLAPISYLADTQNEPSEILAARQLEKLKGEGLSAALEALDERSRRIIEARWLNVAEDGSERAKLEKLGDEIGVSAERVRQIQASALKKMRKVLAAYK